MATSGTESILASAMPVTRFVAPGPRVEKQTPASAIATLGWCFGGAMSFEAARMFPDKLAATVIYYGQVSSDRAVLEPLKMPILGIFAGADQHITAESARAFEKALHQLGKEAEVTVYDGVGHAFANPSGTAYRKAEAEDAWRDVLLREYAAHRASKESR